MENEFDEYQKIIIERELIIERDVISHIKLEEWQNTIKSVTDTMYQMIGLTTLIYTDKIDLE